MNRRSFITLAGGGAVLAAGAYAYASNYVFPTPTSAISAWKEAGEPEDIRRFALSYAILAPNSHNMQPWMADLSRADEISISLDPQRYLPETDPLGRQMMMGLGCFLELLEMAAAERGVKAETSLFPDGVPGEKLDGRRVAIVRFSASQDAEKDPLFAHVLDRRTDRRAYDVSASVHNEDVKALSAAAGVYNVVFGIETGARVQAIRDIANDAWRRELTTEPAFMESMKVLRIGTSEIDRHRDGLAIEAPFLVMLDRFGLFDRNKMPEADSIAIKSQIDSFAAATASTPAYLWIVTKGNKRSQQVEAGRAYLRACLAATGLGLAMHPNQQSLQEYPEVAEPYQAIHQLLDAPAPQNTVQMLARLGRLPKGAGTLVPAPRRGIEKQIV